MRKIAHALAIELTVALLSSMVSASAAKLQVLYSFCSVRHCSDGDGPVAPPIRDASGNLYGTTYEGGTYYGTIYKLAPNGTETVLYTFNGDGGYIRDGVVMDKSGNLFGTSDWGGTASVGLVFRLAADGTESTLYSFAGGTDGAYPEAGLIIDSNGNLYGTTYYGGSPSCSPYGCGTVFKVAPDGAETVLYRFCETAPCSDGAGPHATVLAECGEGNCGVIFKLAPDGTETLLRPRIHGASQLVLEGNGELYGATAEGGAHKGGTVFVIKK